MTGALFGFDHVTVVRGGTTVLDDVTVTIPDGGITALVGRSGAGKSTLLRCCNRLEAPTDGRVSYRGQDVSTLDPLAHRRRVAMVFQSPVVFPGTVLENLRAASPDLGDHAAADLLRRVGLAVELTGRVADTLSGGEAQRLCLARALATGPAALLADEPTSALDDDAARVLEELARGLAADGVPVVWVAHDRAQVGRLADHVIALEGGRVVSVTPARPGGAAGAAGAEGPEPPPSRGEPG